MQLMNPGIYSITMGPNELIEGEMYFRPTEVSLFCYKFSKLYLFSVCMEIDKAIMGPNELIEGEMYFRPIEVSLFC